MGSHAKISWYTSHPLFSSKYVSIGNESNITTAQSEPSMSTLQISPLFWPFSFFPPIYTHCLSLISASTRQIPFSTNSSSSSFSLSSHHIPRRSTRKFQTDVGFGWFGFSELSHFFFDLISSLCFLLWLFVAGPPIWLVAVTNFFDSLKRSRLWCRYKARFAISSCCQGLGLWLEFLELLLVLIATANRLWERGNPHLSAWLPSRVLILMKVCNFVSELGFGDLWWKFSYLVKAHLLEVLNAVVSWW